MTESVKDRLIKKFEDEIQALNYELKLELPKEIKRARELGDLRENAEYAAAKERQRLVEARISLLQKRVSEIALLNVDRIPKDRAGFGSTLHVVETTGEKIMIVTGYGSTETGPFASTTTWPVGRPGEVGLPAPGVELKLVPNGEKLELRLKGESITPGYWRQPDKTAEALDAAFLSNTAGTAKQPAGLQTYATGDNTRASSGTTPADIDAVARADGTQGPRPRARATLSGVPGPPRSAHGSPSPSRPGAGPHARGPPPARELKPARPGTRSAHR